MLTITKKRHTLLIAAIEKNKDEIIGSENVFALVFILRFRQSKREIKRNIGNIKIAFAIPDMHVYECSGHNFLHYFNTIVLE